MTKEQISQEFIEAALKLGEEILEKDNLTYTEKVFINKLDQFIEFIEKRVI